ncbi:MAG: hypothetical protein II306_04115 [Clostridia bacterium]|nr:hypothetical protein [Clostridia bacterium]
MTTEMMNEYLERYRIADNHIDCLIEEKQAVKERALRCGITPSDGSKSVGSHTDTVARSVEKMILLEQQIDKQIDALVAMREDIMNIISKLDDYCLEQLMYQKYICGHTLETIGENIGYCTKQVGRLHKKALSILAEICS